MLFTFLFLWYWTRAILCSKWAQKRTNYYPLLKRWCAHTILHACACMKTPNSIVKSYKEHSLKVSAQSDLKHKWYSTLMIFMQILELFFVFCPTVDFWYNQLITNHPDKSIWKIYKHQKTKKPIWRGQQNESIVNSVEALWIIPINNSPFLL